MVASQGLHNTLKLPDKGKVAQICNFFGGWSTWCSSFGVWFGILVELSSPFQRVRTNKVYYWLLGHAYFVKIAADIFFYWKVPGYQVPVRSGGETRKISEGRSCCALDRYVPFFSLTFSLSLFLKPLCSMTPSLHVHLHLLPSTHPDRIPACWQQPMCVLTYQRGSIAGKDIVFLEEGGGRWLQTRHSCIFIMWTVEWSEGKQCTQYTAATCTVLSIFILWTVDCSCFFGFILISPCHIHTHSGFLSLWSFSSISVWCRQRKCANEGKQRTLHPRALCCPLKILTVLCACAVFGSAWFTVLWNTKLKAFVQNETRICAHIIPT